MIKLYFSSVKMWEAGERKSHLFQLSVFSINMYLLVQNLTSSSMRPRFSSSFIANKARGLLRQA